MLTFLDFRLGIGTITALIISSFTVAQLVSAPLWGKFSDRVGRRPTLLIALTASAIAYLIFGFADSLWLLLLSRIVQGAGGGTVGVIQAYVADSTAPQDRARALGWLSATTNLGVTLGPVLGSFAITLGKYDLVPGSPTLQMGHAAPGIIAATLCILNIAFAARYLTESRDLSEHVTVEGEKNLTSRQALLQVVSHSSEPSSRLIWIYAIAMGAYQGSFALLALFLNARFQVTEQTIGYFFMYVGSISVFTRVLLLGRMVDWLGESKLSRLGLVLLAAGVLGMPLSHNLWMLGLTVALIPLGTAFTFPCVTALLSRVIRPKERGLVYGNAADLWRSLASDRAVLLRPMFRSSGRVVALLLRLGVYRRHDLPEPTAHTDYTKAGAV